MSSLEARVTLRLYGPYQEAAGRRDVVVAIPAGGAALSDLLSLLGEQYPRLAALVRDHMRRGATPALVVNGRVAGFDERVEPDSLVLLLPPLSGGRR